MMSAAAASLLIRRQRHLLFRGFVSGEWTRRWSSSIATRFHDSQLSSSSARGEEKLPLLMVSCSAASSPASRCLYSLTKDDTSHISYLERHHRDLTLPAGIISYDDYSLTGSSRGFFFFRPKSGGGDIWAINPVTGAHFRLPPVPDSAFRMKVVLSPSLDTAVLLPENTHTSNAEFTRLPSSSSSSSHWTPFSLPPHIYSVKDCIFHKNRLYVVDLYDRVAAFDEDVFAANYHPSSNLPPSATWSYDRLPAFARLRLGIHLVESPDGDHLSLVFRCATPRGSLPCKTMRWWVYNLDHNGQVWKPVKSIGDSALFMGAYGGMFLPVRRHSSCVLEPDCVYFSDRPNPRHPIQKGLVDTGMYHLEDGTVELIPVTDCGKILDYSPPVWLPPAAF